MLGEVGEMSDFRLGRWQDTLADVECDALIVDAPYGAKTHKGHNTQTANMVAEGKASAATRTIDYAHWTATEVNELVESWAPRTKQWMVCMTSHDLIPVYQAAYEAAGWYAFAPLPWVNPGGTVRLSGDGPASWTCYIMVARPRTKAAMNWRALPGAYVMPQDRGARIGGKPLGLMRALIRDYSNPGDMIADPCAGYATTLIAAHQMDRRAVGAEIDADAHAEGLMRIEREMRQGLLL
jgi:site-specific DNA-methyltransferase (adenine-specific)